MFQAKLTDSIPEGYTIETVIDGKPLRGFLFVNKANSVQPSTHTSGSRYVVVSSFNQFFF